jgi:hypothetical protein
MQFEPSTTQIWFGITLTFVVVALLAYNIWSGQADRAIIKDQVASILGNISATEEAQAKTLTVLNQTVLALTETSNVLSDVVDTIAYNTASNRNMTVENQKMLLNLNSTYSPEFANATKEIQQRNLAMLTMLNNTFNPEYVRATTENRESINDTLQQLKQLITRLEQNVTKEIEGSIASTR